MPPIDKARRDEQFKLFNLFYFILFHDLLSSPISQHGDWSELTYHNSLNRDQAWSQFSLDARRNVTAQREQQYNETQSNFL